MTTAFGGHRLRPAVVRVPRAPHSVKVLHSDRHLRLWRGRLVLGALIAGAMAGALLGVAWALSNGVTAPVEALRAYGTGAGAGAAAGLVLGLVLSVLLGLVDRFLLPRRVAATRAWVRHRR